MMNEPNLFGPLGAQMFAWVGILVLWSIFWKALALWHSARRAQPWWFLILFFVNTLGILEIIYLFGVAKVKTDKLFKK